MHELSVTESILEIALRHATSANASRITSINLVIGRLSSIVDDSVQFYWDIVSKDTLAEGSRLSIRRIPAELLCLDCNCRYNLLEGELACPGCGSVHVKVVAGEEFYVEFIKVLPAGHKEMP